MKRAFLLCLVLAACSKSKPSATSTKPTAAAPGSSGVTSSGRGRPAGAGMHVGMAPITVEEVTPLLPTPEGAKVATALAKANAMERVEVGWCFDSPTLDDAKKSLETALTPIGWGVVWHAAPNQPDSTMIIAHKDDFLLTGSVGKLAGDCPGIVAKVGVHKQSGRMGPHRPIGPGGIRMPPAPPVAPPGAPPATPPAAPVPPNNP